MIHGSIFTPNRPTGEIILEGQAASGCDSVVRVQVNYRPEAIGAVDTTLCWNETFAYENQVFGGDRTGGRVRLPGASADGCDSLVEVTVTVLARPVGLLDTTVCAGETVAYFGRLFSAGRPAGRVRIPVPSRAGCDSTVDVRVRFRPQEIGVIDTLLCAGDTLWVAGRAFTGENTRRLAETGVADRFGCDSLVRVTTRIRPRPRVQLRGDGVVCAGQAVRLALSYSGPGTATVALSSDPNGDIELFPGLTIVERMLPVGTTVTVQAVTTPGVCTPVIEGAVTVRETTLVGVDISVLTGEGGFDLACAGDRNGAVLASPVGGVGPYAFRWDTGDSEATLTGLGAGEYAVEIISARGCRASGRVALREPPPVGVTLSQDPLSCTDTVPTLVVGDTGGGAGPYTYRTDPDVFLPLNLPDTLNLPLGTSLVEVEDANGCRLRTLVNYAPPPPDTLFATPARILLPLGDSVQLNLSSTLLDPAYTLIGGGDSTGVGRRPFVGPLRTTVYEIIAEDDEGCAARAFVRVLIDDSVPVYIPNVFSPNGDGTNDRFRLFAQDEAVVAFHDFAIYSRWGDKVYEEERIVYGEQTDWGWDGMNADGRPYGQAVFVYRVTVELANGQRYPLSGDVTIVR